MAINSLLVNTLLVSFVMLLRSFPAISGAASMHQRLKWARSSAALKEPFPTSSISGSFQWPGPAYCSSPLCRSRLASTLPPQILPLSPSILLQLLAISPEVLHRCPMPAAHSQGLFDPHSQILKTMGLPALYKASRMSVYDAFAFWLPVLHQSSFR